MNSFSERITQLSEDKRALLERLLSKKGVEVARTVILPRKGNSNSAPLSFAQQRLWLLDQLEPNSSAYNIALASKMEGHLNVMALEQALDEMIRRHESLRTTFTSVDGIPTQVISPHSGFHLLPIDLSQLPAEQREREAQVLFTAESERPFTLSSGPLMRLLLVKFAEQEHALLLVMHHIISDGWSMSIFTKELATLYHAFAAGRPSPLPELPIQYADYAQWQRNWLSGERLTEQLAYWKSQLSGAPPLLELPTDFPRPPVQSFRGAAVSIELSADLTREFKRVCRAQAMTPFMGLLAAFALLLSRHSRQRDILIGTPVAGRTRLETESLIGFFVNTLVLRVRIEPRQSVSELWEAVKEATLQAHAHQDVPFEKLVEELEPERSLSYSPLFQVMFAMQNTVHEEATQLGEVTVSSLHGETETAKFDLTIEVEESGDTIQGKLSYNRDIFSHESIERMAAQYERIVEQMVRDSEQAVSRIELLSAAEREQLIAGWNETHREYEKSASIAELIEAQAARTPEAIALSHGGRELSYQELNERANQLAHYLQEQGVGPEVLVGVLLERSVEMVVSLLAVLKAGGAYIPLDPAYPPQRLALMLEDAAPLVLLTQASLRAAVPAVAAQIRCVDSEWEQIAAPQSVENPAREVRAENLAYVIYTSGSTGRPKGVAITHASAITLLQWAHELFSPEELRGVLFSTSICFDLSIFEMFVPLSCGGQVLLAENALQLAGLAERERVTLINTVPSAMAELVRGSWVPESVATVNLAGEALTRELVVAVYGSSRVQRVWNLYGPSEDTTYSTAALMESEGQEKPLIGRPIANTAAYVLDEAQQVVPVGVAGELYLGGEGLARGYLKRPELTAEKFVPHPFSATAGARLYRTGDLVRYRANGELEYLGRIDQQVKVRGYRIELGEIEAVLRQQSGVQEAVVVVREEGGEKRLVGYVVGEEGQALSISELKRAVGEQLPDYMVPSVLVALEQLPLTPNGKVDRKALPAPQFTRAELAAPYVAPRTPSEEIVAGIWAEVLKVEEVGVYDNFFELGGHSLLATQVISRVRSALSVELALRSLFEQPTVAGLAALIEQESGGEEQRIEVVSRDGELLLSYAQQRLWFLDQLKPNSSAYNLPTAVRFYGPLNVTALEQALNEISRRHESLRTNFIAVDGQPIQVIAPYVPTHLPLLDLTDLPAAQRETEVRALFTTEAARAFNLSNEPLLRLQLVKLDEQDYALLLVMHHIISDGWSMNVFGRELTQLYKAFCEAQPSPLAELPIQYADYAQWQRNWLTGERLTEQLGYWKDQLSDAPPLLELPTDYPRPAVQSFRGAAVSIELSAELTAEFKRVCRAQAMTPFMGLLAAYSLLLSRHSRQRDILIGTPVAGRTRLETESLIGFFVNTLVLRTEIKPEQRVSELWAAVKEVTLQAHAHQDVPFEKLVEELEPERSLSYSPLFQVMFTLQNTPSEAVELAGLKLEGMSSEGETAKFDLTLGMEESGGQLRGSLVYNCDMFSHESMARMAAQYERIVEQMVQDSEQAVSRIELLSAAEREQLIAGWNETHREYEKSASIAELIEAQAARTPEAIALSHGGRELSYQELNERANQLAHYLQEQGVGAEVLVGVLLERSVEMVVSQLAVLKAGGAYIPLDPAYPAQRLALMLEDPQVAVILTQQSLLGSISEGAAPQARIVSVDSEWEQLAELSNENPARRVVADNLAYVIYTSGSTGKPKGVAITHSSLLNLVHWSHQQLAGQPVERATQIAGISFDASVWEVWSALSAGTCLYLPDEATRLDPLQLRDWLVREQINNTFVPTPVAEVLLRGEWPEGSALQRLQTGGDRLHDYRPVGHTFQLINNYGPTEATVIATAATIGERGERGELPTIGRPIANTDVYVLNEAQQVVPVGVAGELYIGGDGLARGYLRQPELTAEKFVPHPFSATAGARLYRTGDLVRYRTSGELEYLGRIDQQVKVRGYRIELGEIEAVLRQQAGVRDAIVVVRDKGADKRLIAYVVGDEADATDGIKVAELKRRIAEQLPEYMVPSVIVVMPELPLTPNGKVDRKALPVPQFTRDELETGYVAARTEIEQLLVDIWAEVLKVEKLGVYDNFFALGGHSLLATQVMSRVRVVFGVELPLRHLFEMPTVAGLATVIERERSLGGEEQRAITRVSREGELMLSYGQQRLWFMDQLDSHNPAYNIPVAARLVGALNVGALEQVLDEIVRRHESLRTSFISVDGQPVQVISPHSRFSLPVIDLSDLAGDEQHSKGKALLQQEATTPFDLASGSLFRACLLRLSDTEHVLLVVMHHIISDGWSMNIFSKELVTLYASFVAGRPSPLAELPIQYADYAQWQRTWLAGERLTEQLAYWKQQLGNAPPLLELPTNPRPAVQRFRGAVVPVELSAELTTQLKQVCRAQAMTPFMVLLSAYSLLLSRHSRQNDVSIGTPIAGRTRLETESLIGFFVNTLVLRTQVNPEQRVSELWKAVKEVTLQAHAHQDVPFEKLVEELEPARTLSYSPLFQVMFTLQNTPTEAVELEGLKLEGISTDGETAKFDLTLGMEESGGQFRGGLVYNVDLFSHETIERMVDQYERIVAQMVSDGEQVVSGIQLLSAAEREQIVTSWNETQCEYRAGATIHELIEEQAARTPQLIAVVSEEEEITYQELNERANRLAHYLQEQGVGPEVLVGVLLERSVDMVVSLLAVLKAGGAYVPLDPGYPDERLSFMLRDAGASILLTGQQCLEARSFIPPQVICLDTDQHLWAEHNVTNLHTPLHSEMAAYVIYTSGSTGRPKGVLIPHRAICNHLLWRQSAYALSTEDRFLQKASFSFDISVWEIFGTLMAGASLILARHGGEKDPAYLVDLMAARQVSVAHFGPALLQAVLDEPGFAACHSVKRVFCGGEALSSKLAEQFFSCVSADLHHQYGPTETTVDVTIWDCERDTNEDVIPIGRPIANTEAYVLDARMEPVPVGVAGELYIGGASVGRGYLGRTELTAEKFVPHPFSATAGARLYRTGDLVRYRTSGELEYLGRIDQQVKVRGYRIELGEIEAMLRQQAGVREAVVIARDEGADKRLVGYVVGVEPQAISVAELKRAVGEQLPEYMVPSVIVPLEQLPLTPNGKLDRKALPAPQLTRAELESPYVAPRTPSEEIVAAIWADVLKVEEVGVYDNFFELGGHSLLATQVISRVRAALSVELALRRLFEQPTVAGLAALIEQESAGEEQRIEVVSREGELLLSYAQQRLWFLDQLEPHSTAYNIPTAVKLLGQLDLSALGRSLAEIVRRHESLRTSFASVDGRPIQVISPPAVFSLPVIDLSELTEDQQRSSGRQLLEEQARKPFDLSTGPLFRVRLIKLSAEEHVLALVMHHIISDGWSMNVFGRELTQLYKAFCEAQPSPLAELPIQYADYAQWQRNWLTGERLTEQLGYWKDQLSDAPPLLELPTDYPRPAVQSFRGAAVSIELSAELTAEFKRVCRAQAMTPFMGLLSAFSLLLSRHSRQRDILIGTPVAGRTRLETESLIGFFVNTLVLRTEIKPEQRVNELWAAVKEVTLQAHAHQDVPFEKLVEELEPERSLSYSPLFQVMFTLQNTPSEAVQLAGLKLEGMSSEGETAKFDLTLGMEESGGQLRGSLVYNCDMFSHESMARMAAQYERIVEQMVQDSEQAVSRIELLSAAEREQLIAGWNETHREYEKSASIAELIEAQAARTPEAIALSHGGRELSYQELNERANQLAHYLQEQGVGPEVLVGVLLERSVEMVVSLLAVLKAGGAYIPLDPAYPSQRLALMLEDAAPLVLLTQASLRAAVPEVAAQIRCVDSEWEQIAATQSVDNPAREVRAENLAYVIYTSGSTGRPKGVAITHASAITLLQWAHELFSPEELRGVLFSTSICFDLSIFEMFVPLSCGGQVLLAENALQLAGLAERERVTLINTVPSAMAELVRGSWVPESVATVNLAGEALTRELVAAVYGSSRVQRVWNLYGPSEDTTYSTAALMESEGQEKPLIGRPIANTAAYVLDEAQQVVPVGVAGELYLGGEGLARGYLKRPELTAEKFVPHPFSATAGARLYRTGDLVRYRANGELEYLGRIDQQVKVRGYRIELGEIEAVLRQQSGVQEAVVVVREEGGEKRLVGYVVGEEGQALSISELKRAVGEQLPDYMVPSVLVALEQLPLTPNGKVDRKALPAPQFTRAELAAPYVAPRTPSEEIVAGIWAEVLKIEEVGVYDNFFELGGHSLLATQVISRVRAALSVELALRSLFEQPTVAGLTALIEQASAGEEQRIEVVSRDGELLLSYAQQRLWFLDQLDPHSSAYNIPAAASFSGQLNITALEQALNEISRRHESLRTTFTAIDGQPLQVISPYAPFSLPTTDLSHLPEDERRTNCRELLQQEATTPFDLATGPLFRTSLIRMSETEHVLLVVMHHIISDGWSMGIFSKELVTLYQTFAAGQQSPLTEPPIQYADYAQWQRNWLAGERLAEQLTYWKEQLRDAPALLDLPTDYPRPAVQSFRGASVSIELSAELTTALKQACRREGMTSFMLLLSAFSLLLSRHSRQTEISIGTPMAGRTRLETESLIGLFVNTLVLRIQLERGRSVRELWAQAKEVILQAHAHQDVPFEKLVEELQPERSLSYSPLFQVMFTLQNTTEETVEIEGLKVAGISTGVETAKFDLTLGMQESGGQLRGSLVYNRDLFSRESMERMAAQYQLVLQEMVRDSEQQVTRIALLTEAEREQIISSWNETASEFEPAASVTELIEAQAGRTAAAAAISHAGRELSYQELNERANRLAHYLQEQGVGPEVLVGVLLERSMDMVVSQLAVLKAGGAYIPLDPAYPQQRLALILAEAEPALVLTQAKLRATVGEEGVRLISVDTDSEQWAGASPANPASRVSPTNLAYVIYTSGSTGKPKGVAITHGSLLNLVHWSHQRFYRQTVEHTTHVAGLSFDASVWEVWPALSAGACLYLPDEETRLDPLQLRDWLVREQISTSFIPTPVAEVLLRVEWPEGSALQRLLTGGDRLHEYRRAAHTFELINNYGPTEATVVATAGTVGERGEAGERGELPAIGRPIANAEVYVLDEEQQVVPVGVAGELYIGGEGLARGYLKRPELTAEKFVPHPFSARAGARLYRTGDLVRYRASGELDYLGRIDQQVKIRGYRIELGEIEAVLRQAETVREAVVVVREESGEKRLIGYVVGLEPQAINIAELKRSLEQQLPEYMVPSAIVELEQLPLTPNGKLDRKALPAPQLSRSDLNHEYIAPRDAVEFRLARIWEDALDLRPIGIRDNFFTLGGHSLLAVRLVANVEKEFGRKLQLTTLFNGGTIEQMASVLRKEVGPTREASMVTIRSSGERKPFFFVHPVGGHVFCYVALAHHLGQEQPFYGLQLEKTAEGRPVHTDIESMASHYLEELRVVQPEGPYFLGGWSMGGVVALEMAQQLQARGQEVKLLALVDSTIPNSRNGNGNGNGAARKFLASLMPSGLRKSVKSKEEAGLLRGFARDMGISFEQFAISTDELEKLPPEEQLDYVMEKGREAGVVPEDVDLPVIERLYEVFKNNHQALKSYVPNYYHGQAALFKTEERLVADENDPTLGWGKVVQALELQSVPGNHYTIVREPHVKALAERLRDYCHKLEKE